MKADRGTPAVARRQARRQGRGTARIVSANGFAGANRQTRAILDKGGRPPRSETLEWRTAIVD